jgi:hypothetical protein
MMLGSSANLQVREKRIKTKENQKSKSKQKKAARHGKTLRKWRKEKRDKQGEL